MRPDIAQAHRFIAVLAGREPITLQTFSDRDELKVRRPDGKLYDPNAGWKHGSFEAYELHLMRLNAQGAGVFVMVNEGDGQGRTAKNVRRVRALFIDTDGAPFPTDLPLMPHIVVESSLGKWHIYWLVSDLDLEDFSALQEALAHHYGTDPSVKDLPRVMRLPGYYHFKAEPVLVQLLEAHDHPPYTLAEVYEAYGFLQETLARRKVIEAEQVQRRTEMHKRAAERRASGVGDISERTRANKLLQGHYDTVAQAGEGSRNATLYRSAYTLGGYVGAGYLGPHEVEDVLLAAALLCGLPEGEVRGLIPCAVREGMKRPLELYTPFAATPRLGANPSASNQDRAAPSKPLLVQPCNNKGKPSLGANGRSGMARRPRLGGKPCL